MPVGGVDVDGGTVVNTVNTGDGVDVGDEVHLVGGRGVGGIDVDEDVGVRFLLKLNC